MTSLFEQFAGQAGLGPAPTFPDVVEAIREIPYARTSERSAECVVREWRGTCSTKHMLLAALASERFTNHAVRLIHRVYHLSRRDAARLFGRHAAMTVPLSGLTDVHTYATAVIGRERIVVDATFAGEPWDGRSHMTPACGPGEDFAAGSDAWESKERLVADFCDPSVREPFLEALSA